MYFSEKKVHLEYTLFVLPEKSVNEVYLANVLHLYFKYLSKGQKGGFGWTVNACFWLPWIVNERIYFSWSVRKSDPVIREITNLFIEIREQGL